MLCIHDHRTNVQSPAVVAGDNTINIKCKKRDLWQVFNAGESVFCLLFIMWDLLPVRFVTLV